MRDFNFTQCLKDLFNYNRSLTGEGTLKTIKYFQKINPELKIIRFKSGTRVFDWRIPKVWNVKEAFIKHLNSKKKFAEFRKNNLHLVGYSVPTNKIMQLKELKKKIHILNNLPSAIPYVTSYYKKNWGFCLSKNSLKKLPKGNYFIKIDSKFTNGYMNGAHALIKGKVKKEILFSSYICHPSMANNELSGPILLNSIINFIRNNYKKTYFTYRFVLMPETIGSIAYLSKYHKYLKKNTFAAFNLTCVGDGKSYSLIETKDGNSISDNAIKCQIIKKKKFKIYSFLDRGSDERQYNSPGINIPMSTFCRSKFGSFKEYHNSLDNLSLVKEKHLKDSFKIFKNIINSFEMGIFPKVTFSCEPMLSKRNLYPSISKLGNYSKELKDRMNFIAYCDGRNIFEISLKTGIELEKLVKEYKILNKSKVLKRYFEKRK